MRLLLHLLLELELFLRECGRPHLSQQAQKTASINLIDTAPLLWVFFIYSYTIHQYTLADLAPFTKRRHRHSGRLIRFITTRTRTCDISTFGLKLDSISVSANLMNASMIIQTACKICCVFYSTEIICPGPVRWFIIWLKSKGFFSSLFFFRFFFSTALTTNCE